MAAALDSDHFGAWYKLAVPLFFAAQAARRASG
jgi:hypothetical protein